MKVLKLNQNLFEINKEAIEADFPVFLLWKKVTDEGVDLFERGAWARAKGMVAYVGEGAY